MTSGKALLLLWVSLALVGFFPDAVRSQRTVPLISETCLQEPDADRDQLSDACEEGLATVFAPELVVSDHACNWTGSQLGGGYLFGASWLTHGESVRIAYLPAYFADCGWSGRKCWLRVGGGCRSHLGDSELIIVDVVRGSSEWRVDGVFMSAHCFGDDRCRWYRGEELAELEWVGPERVAGPVVWVAEGKNANYPSRRACDRGHWFYDTCDRNWARYRFPLQSRRNIGSRDVPLGGGGCVSSAALGPEAEPHEGSVECIWAPVPFRGWGSQDAPGVTPYLRYLADVVGWT